ncbi:MAG: hypothetical protein N3F05_01025 [Candidatus Diapherotrites archaeon]|nr:hypothetical protein [Candidatus Diapherotrites archaeon]
MVKSLTSDTLLSMDTFRLFVVAFLAIVMIALLLQIFGLFEPTLDLEKEIKELIRIAESQPGKYFSKMLPLQGTLIADIFENEQRSLIFLCNSPSLCCEMAQKCGKNLEWNNIKTSRFITSKQKKQAYVSVRCRFQSLTICKVYFGQEPAQITIESFGIDVNQNTAFAGENIYINYSIKNTGKTSLIATSVAKLYASHTELSGEVWLFIKDFKGKDFALLSNESANDSINFSITAPGKYKIELFVYESNDETNFDSKSFELMVFEKKH